MGRIVASLAAVLAALAIGACGDDGAEPDAPGQGVAPAGDPVALDLVLEFQPNAVHTGIYVAKRRGFLRRQGVELTIREPGASTDAPKLLRSGRADLAILDIHDLAIARERGIDLVGVGAIVQRPLAAVIAGDREQVSGPADLEGLRIGVTGLPSDDAVLASVLGSAGLGLDDVSTVTIGFDSVPTLASGRVGAVTAFWNAEGVALKDLDVPTRELRVDEFGAPAYPELVLATTAERIASEDGTIARALDGIEEGYRATVEDPDAALADLLASVRGLEHGQQRRQLQAVLGAFGPELALDRDRLERWAEWDLRHGIVERRPEVEAAFNFELAP